MLRFAPLVIAAFSLVGASCRSAPAFPPASPTTVGPTLTQRADQALPPASEVLARAVKAVGGQAKLDELHSYYSAGKTTIANQNLTMTERSWWKQGASYTEVELESVGTTEVWINAQGVWSDDPINGRRKLEGKEERQARWSSTPLLAASWRQFFASAQTVDRHETDGKTVLEVRLSNPEGDELMLEFEETTGLLVGQQYLQVSPQAEMVVKVRVLEWDNHGGFLAPKRSKSILTAVAEAETVIETFEPNAAVEDAKVQPPPWATATGAQLPAHPAASH